MRAVLVELSRFRSRRAIVALLLAMFALSFVVLSAIVYETRPLTATEMTRAEQRFERERVDALPQIEQCREDPSQFFGDDVPVEECDTIGPQLEWFTSRPVLDVAETVSITGPGLGVLLAALAVLVGATFAGADWTSGSMINQLLFRPRRLRVWSSKATAVVLGTTLAAGLVLLGFWAGIVAVAQARDITVGEPLWRGIGLGSLRSLALVAAAALGGFSLTMWLRRTGGTIGAMFGLVVVVELMAFTLPFERVSQWSLLNNLAAWVGNGTEVIDESICSGSSAFDGGCDPSYVLSLEHGAAYLGVLLLLAVGVSLLSFTRRDIA